jgi:hypothetical protein
MEDEMNTRMMRKLAEKLPDGDMSIRAESAAYLMAAAQLIDEVKLWANGVLETWHGEPAKGELHCRYCGTRFYCNDLGDITDTDTEHHEDCSVLAASQFLT